MGESKPAYVSREAAKQRCRIAAQGLMRSATGYLEYEHSRDMEKVQGHLRSHFGDLLPLPRSLGIAEYTYLSYLTVNVEYRRRGEARKLASLLLDHFPKSDILVVLVNSDITNGLVMLRMFSDLDFEVSVAFTDYARLIRLAPEEVQ